MATLKERPDTWSAGGIYLRDFRQDKGDGYEDTRHQSKHGKAAKKKYVRKGCPGNNGKQHVYVWVSERFRPYPNGKQIDRGDRKNFWPAYPWMTWERELAYLEGREAQVCCGCYRIHNTRRKVD